tara:strand:+ start:1188 stop:1562 length:375 start_codon:yes stop_codon:yes gene_type:complete
MLKHKHLLVRAEVLDPPKDIKEIKTWTKKLIKDIDMKILAGPYAKYCDVKGNRGLTCVTIIETSHIALHSWDENDPALVQLDVYSCKDLDEKIVFDYLYKFQPVRMSYRYFDRETNFKLIKVKR